MTLVTAESGPAPVRPATRAWTLHTRQVGPAVDLLAFYRPDGFFFERSGMGLVAIGQALVLSVPRLERASKVVAEALDEIGPIADGSDAPLPVAVGAFPFARGPAQMIVPRRTLRRSGEGLVWEVIVRREVSGSQPDSPVLGTGSGQTADAGEMDVTAVPSPEAYLDAVAEATRRIREGAFRKVVLARQLVVEARRAFVPEALLRRLRAVDPDAYTFGVPSRDHRVLVGATPELLVSKQGRDVLARPLAGSSPRFGDPAADGRSAAGLKASAKDRDEHAAVVEGVVAALDPLCLEVRADAEPSLLATANVWHLATEVHGLLPPEPPSVLDIVAALHPTPAVCGWPREPARAALAELESIDRGLYAGPVGWVDSAGDGDWAVALRCAELSGSTARLFAGAGIVADSEPRAELEETDQKFRALLDSLRWG